MRTISLASALLLALAMSPTAHAGNTASGADASNTASTCDTRPKPRSARDMHTARYPRGRIITRDALDRTSDVNLAGAISKASTTAHFGHQAKSHDELLACYTARSES